MSDAEGRYCITWSADGFKTFTPEQMYPPTRDLRGETIDWQPTEEAAWSVWGKKMLRRAAGHERLAKEIRETVAKWTHE